MWFTTSPSSIAQARQHDVARQQAEHLRQQAIADFWRGTDAMLYRAQLSAAAQAERSAQRWQARLARRQSALALEV